ncbi:hypothetical protein EIN_174460 [Entamoeba invadens IP1]|uniref:Uncharacterized protein n=1 Tax=Entamoeba invadens IP1 TaxID=370355 RepID=A0A0A1TW85_ENTIV|nr:hypothetical protein EIN_174460 [Entamoeba invadens IP1]ELP84751.1 hypothetical protein EIN_174460 [Entamoeba invadens IP1]|eukprot:XP_004184097.1 hypothetical protein EIN_174460 [Entamoeba invadens IP1]
MDFLAKKRSNPRNFKNRLRVENAEKEIRERADLEKKRQTEITEQKEKIAYIRSNFGEEAAFQATKESQIMFLYEPPPGFSLEEKIEERMKEKKIRSGEESKKPRGRNDQSKKAEKKLTRVDPIIKDGEQQKDEIEKLL